MLTRTTTGARRRSSVADQPKLTAITIGMAILAGVGLYGIGQLLSDRIWSRIVTSLEQRVPAPATLHGSMRLSGIIVLGGSHTRLREALSLARELPRLPVIASGPAPHEEALLAEAMASHPELIVDRRPTSTFENALLASMLIDGPADGCWLLVTSALHMPRALGVFRSLGLPVVPWPVDDTPADPDTAASLARHEVLALSAYWLLGRTNSLFPAANQADPPDLGACSQPAAP